MQRMLPIKAFAFSIFQGLVQNIRRMIQKLNGLFVTPEDMKKFSLAGYFFGQKLQEVLSVPVGLIEASWGGTPAEAWTPKDAIDSNAGFKRSCR